MNVDDCVLKLAKDPALARSAPWARDPEVVKTFILYTLSVADSTPREGHKLALTARRIAVDPCDRVQVLGILAQCQRVLGDIEGAAARLADAFELGGDCSECLSDLYRRRVYGWIAVREWERGIEDASEAIRRYEDLGHPGHDLYFNGLSSAYLARGIVLCLSGSNRAGIDDIGRGLALTDSDTSRTLLFQATQNYAYALARSGSPEDLSQAKDYLRQARQHFKGLSRASQERAKLAWVTAMVDEEIRKIRPRPPGANAIRPVRIREMLDLARRDLVGLGYQDDAVALTADLARIAFPDIERIPAIIAELDADLERFGRALPEKIREPLERLRRTVGRGGLWSGGSDDVAKAFEETRKAIEALRGASGDTIACLISWQHVF